jgi:hypothetical protein
VPLSGRVTGRGSDAGLGYYFNLSRKY